MIVLKQKCYQDWV